MLLLNEKETKFIMNVMEFLESLETPEATKQAELIENECYNLLDEVRKEALQEIKKDNGYHNVKLNALKKN